MRRPSIHTRRARSFVAALLLATLVVLAAPILVAASDLKASASPTVPAGTTVAGDVYLAGGRARLLGNVAGDAIVAAAELEVRGRVGGSLSAAVLRADLHGPIARALRVIAGDVDLFGQVGGDLLVAGGSVTVAAGARVRGDVIVAGGAVTLLGTIDGTVRGRAARLTIGGPVAGDVRVESDRVRVTADARIGGDLRYRGRNNAEIASGAVVTGDTERREPASLLTGGDRALAVAGALVRLLSGLIAGALLVLLAPHAAASAADGLRIAPRRALLTGFALLFLVPLAAGLLLATVVGIPVALIAVGVYVAGLYLSQVVVGLALGRVLLPGSWDLAGRGYNLLAMTIGVALLAALRLVPVPYLGLGIAVLTAILGLGGAAVGLRHETETTAAAPLFSATPGRAYIR